MSYTYKPDELEFKSPEDWESRGYAILDSLEIKCINKEVLSEHEKDFLCGAMNFPNPTWENLDACECCKNYKFKTLYLTYFQGLAGGRRYIKFSKDIRGPKVVLPEEAALDLQYLERKGLEWETTIKKTNHKEALLQEISKEARLNLKDFNNTQDVKNDIIRKGSRLYFYKKLGILLHSKYIYLVCLGIRETLDSNNNLIYLNGEVIEFTEYSLIHIIQRHFAQLAKQYNTGKTFHNKDFKPKILGKQLKEIIEKIDKSTLLLNKPIKKIGFNFLGKDYLVWTESKTKSIIGKGNVPYKRLQTFYPVEDISQLTVLKNNSDLVTITPELSVYIPAKNYNSI